MLVKAINQQLPQRHNNEQKNPNFTSSFNPMVMLMDGIEKGGFAASFIAQDGIGMVAPRIYEGLNRNRQKDENGNKTGPLNWEFARREGIREILSGPSAFLIPMGIMAGIKKFSGSANNVHVSHIESLGKQFEQHAVANSNLLNDAQQFKKGYYSSVFENVLRNSTDGNLTEAEITQKADKFANNLLNAENLRAQKNKKAAKNSMKELLNEYIDIRKRTAAPSANEIGAVIKVSDKTVETNLKRLTESLTDYTNDALEKTNKFLKNNSSESLSEFIQKFNKNRAGTRVLSNFGMWGAVVAFYTLIAKLYNMGIKHDPGLKGLETAGGDSETKKGKDVAFQGNLASKLGKAATEGGSISKFFNNFEFNGASMPVNAMLTLLFGFCLPPRYLNAKSDKERKEILVRDITSFAAILFAAKAMSRGFSNMFSKISGLALNVKPADHAKGILHKAKNYFSAGNGIDVLSSEQIVAKYSKIDRYKDGINGFFTFIEENGGNIKKVLKLDKEVAELSENIIGKSIDNASASEIKAAFTKARENNSKDLTKIYKRFASDDNKFVNRAKTYNSAFGFMSTIVLVPVFMMQLAKYCEKMTKKAVEREIAMKNAEQQKSTPVNNYIATNKPTMAGFIK